MKHDLRELDAVLFDLDGVLTPTAEVHQVAWAETFDAWLGRHRPGERAFTVADYEDHVDGKPRYEGVDAFLRSRDVELVWGEPSDLPGDGTVCAVGNDKDARFRQILAERGVDPYPDAVDLLDRLADKVDVAVVSSSANARDVLSASGLLERFEVVVDGVVARREGLPGKPAPDTFLHAARLLAADPSRTAVLEDAISGVQAGRSGGFAPVVGVDRTGSAEALAGAGAHVVVGTLTDPKLQ